MRIDGFVPNTNALSNNSSDILNNIKPGDTIRAQVLENQGSELTLKLSDGTTVLASAATPVEAQKGEFVNFIFRGSIDGKPALEVVLKDIQPMVDQALENIKNTLASLKLPVSDMNIQLALALKERGLQITAETMQKTTELISKNIDLKPDAATFLTATNMSGDQNTIEKLQNLLTGRLKVSNDIADLVKLLENIEHNVETNSKQNTINKNISTNSSVVAKENNPESANLKAMTAGIFPEPKPKPVAYSSAPTVTASNTKTVGVPTGSSPTADTNVVLNDLAKRLAEVAKNFVNTDSPAKADNISIPNSLNKIVAQISNAPKGDTNILNSISIQLESLVNNENIPPEQQMSLKVIAKEITTILLEGPEIQESQSLNGNNIKSIITDTLRNFEKLFIKINENSVEINPMKLYKDMDEALLNLKNAIGQLPVTLREAAMPIINNLESNINFINQLNNYSSYVQIPLSIFNQNTTGELYMLKKGSKARKLDPTNMTVLISLDGNNIGRIDTLLSIDKKNISTNFRLENSDVFKVLKENHKQLYSSLLEKGYRLVDFTYRLMDEPISIVNFEAEAKKEFIKKQNNIDIII